MHAGSCSSRSCSCESVVTPLDRHAPVEPPLQRRLRVLAEVEAVAAVDRLEQQLDLELLELLLIRSGSPCRLRIAAWVQ